MEFEVKSAPPNTIQCKENELFRSEFRIFVENGNLYCEGNMASAAESQKLLAECIVHQCEYFATIEKKIYGSRTVPAKSPIRYFSWYDWLTLGMAIGVALLAVVVKFRSGQW